MDHGKHQRPLLATTGPHLPKLLLNPTDKRFVFPAPHGPPPKRIAVLNACEGCRRRKSRCDGVRPTCLSCRKRNIGCVYASEPGEKPGQTLKRKFNELRQTNQNQTIMVEIYETLKNCPEHDAQYLLRRIRQGVDPETVLRQAKEGNLLLQMSLVPQSNLRYEFPYKTDMPPKLTHADNPYMGSPLYESTFRSSSSPNGASNGASISTRTRPQSFYLAPYHAACLVEPLLEAARPSRWTNVTKDDGLLRKLLKSYFLWEYQWLPAFQKDYFLTAMVSGDERLCSPLLVNATLARACQCCDQISSRAEFWNPSSLYYSFLAEAKRLWELEAGSVPVALTTVQAAVLIDVSYRVNGMDKIGESYLLHAVAAAKSLDLFDTLPAEMEPSMRHAREFTAWCLYSYQTVQTYYFFKEPFVKKMQSIRLQEPAHDQSWHGEIWVKYPMDNYTVPVSFKRLHASKLALHVLINELSCRVFGGSEPIAKLSFREATEFQTKLDSWYDGLQEPLTAASIVFPAHFKLHLEYHRATWLLWETFVDIDTATTLAIARSLQCRYIWRSKIRFESLLRLYYLRHSFSGCDQYLTVFLSTLAFSALDELRGEDTPTQQDALISTGLLCGKGLYDQGRTCYVAEVVYRLVRDAMSPKVSGLLAQHVQSEDGFEARKGRANIVTKSEWPIPVANVGEDPNVARLENLVKALL